MITKNPPQIEIETLKNCVKEAMRAFNTERKYTEITKVKILDGRTLEVAKEKIIEKPGENTEEVKEGVTQITICAVKRHGIGCIFSGIDDAIYVKNILSHFKRLIIDNLDVDDIEVHMSRDLFI